MKRIYIKPETESFVCQISSLLDGSNGTNWGIGNEDDPNEPGPNIGGGDNPPDPNEDAKGAFGFDNLWDIE